MLELTEQEKEVITRINPTPEEEAIILSILAEERALVIRDGKKHLNEEYSKNVAQLYGIEWPNDSTWELIEAIDFIIDMERMKKLNPSQTLEEMTDEIERVKNVDFQHKAEENSVELTPIDAVVEYLKLNDTDLADGNLADEYVEILAKNLVEAVDGTLEELVEGINKAVADGILSDKSREDLLSEVAIRKNLNILINKINEEYGRTDDRDEALKRVAGLIVEYCNDEEGLVDVGIIIEESLVRADKEELEGHIYNKLCYDVETSYEVSRDFVGLYDWFTKFNAEFDINRVLEELSKKELKFNLNDFKYEVYSQTDEKNVFQVLLSASDEKVRTDFMRYNSPEAREELAVEIANSLSSYIMQWSEEMIIKSIRKFETIPPRRFLPYNEICNKLENKQVEPFEFNEKNRVVVSLPTEQTAEDYLGEQDAINTMISNISTSIKEQEAQIEDDFADYQKAVTDAIEASDIVDNPSVQNAEIGEFVENVIGEEKKPNRMKIKNKQRSQGIIEKSKTRAALVMATGMIATGVLVFVFKVNPLEAAQNCWASIESLASGTGSLSQLLPDSGLALGYLAAAGTTLGGLGKYSSSLKKLDKLKEEELEQFQEKEKTR